MLVPQRPNITGEIRSPEAWNLHLQASLRLTVVKIQGKIEHYRIEIPFLAV